MARSFMHTQTADMLFLMERDLAALSALLGTQPFITGSKPCDGDCSLFGLLECIYFQPREHPLHTLALKHNNLREYTVRVREALFSDQVGNTMQPFTKAKLSEA